MSALGSSSLRLADDLLSTFENFASAVTGAAATYREAKSGQGEIAHLEAACTFLQAIGEAEREFHDRFVRAARDSQARDEELTG